MKNKNRVRNIPLAMLLVLPFTLLHYGMARYEYKQMIIHLNKMFEQGISSGCTCEVDEDEYDEDENNIVIANDCD